MSKALTCRLYVLFAAAGTDQSHVYGPVDTEQTRFELTKKSTWLTGLPPGVTEAVMGVMDLRVTLAPSVGLEIDTCRPIDPADTVTGTEVDVAVLFAWSVATA